MPDSEQIEHIFVIEHILIYLLELMTLNQNYKFAKVGPKTEIFSNFYEIWQLQQIEHANYEYNTCQYLERSHDYWLRMIIVCKI